MMDDFFTSQPTFTPLMAGTFTLTAAATLASVFGLPGSITAITISFLLAIVIRIDKNIPLLKRIVFYLVNVTTIFIVAMGLNSTGISLTQDKEDTLIEREVEKVEKPFFHSWF
ncbi:MAG: hypothetical protein OQL19_01580 [Gammaproteobacteria bacterium]|nr:hypothetical protein [Gammaproteobacteria bacterium]